MKNKLKILFLVNRNPYPPRDGQTRRTYNIMKGLAKKHEIYFLSLHEINEEIDPKNIRYLKTFCENVEFKPAPCKNFSFPMILRLLCSLFSIYPYTIWRHYSRSYLKRVGELANTRRFDLIHCDILPLYYVVRKLAPLKCVLTDHTVCYLEVLRIARYTRNFLLKLFLYFEVYKLKNLESKLFKQVALGIVVSEFDKKIFEKICPEGKFVAIENGVDTNEFKPAKEKEKPNTLLWIGGYRYYPNREAVYYFLKDIYPLIKLKNNNIKLGLLVSRITRKLKKFAICDPSIELTGYVGNPLPYLQKASIFIIPILTGSGTRLKILEAMATGKAIVTTSIGCEGIAGLNNVHYLIADTPEDFAKSVILLLQDKDLRRYLGDNARKLVEDRYEWEKIYKKMDRIYQDLSGNV